MTDPHRTPSLPRRPQAFFSALAVLGALGVWLLFYSTPQGLGLNDDSIAYIAGARSLLSGAGYREIWIVSAGPVTHFPPGYPGALAAVGLVTGLDPLRGARLLNGLLFGLNIFLTGWLAFRMTGSRLIAMLSAALFLLTPALLRLHSNAMSEPLYIFFTLVTFLLLSVYFAKSLSPKRKGDRGEGEFWLLVAAGAVIGLACLTRYAALALLATGVVALILFHRDWRTRLTRCAILIGGAVPFMAGWATRNLLVGGALTNRAAGWHPI
ncbi:MAG TPA: phospholipid carrier-dependent glycosyltransferase, partial [Anaerolineales bacterium]